MAVRTASRLVGVDVARCLALLGMVATHVLEDRTPDGDLALAQAVAGGRSAALFAVLAGVSLALMSGRREPVRGRERTARSAGIAVRAVLVAVLGLWLGGLDSGLAVILTHYGVLFLLGLPFLGLRAPSLLGWAAAWVVVTPVLSHLVRPLLPARSYANPSFDRLDQPGQLLSELFLTGYYPVLPWVAYLLVGLSLGRLELSRARVQGALTAAGAAVAVLATAGSRVATSQPSVGEALLAGGGPAATSPAELLGLVGGGMYGTTPTGGPWQWLLVVAPHSTTPFDLAQTIGSAVAVIGLALLVVGALRPPGRRVVAVLLGAGSMTLSLYSLHVVMRTGAVPPAEVPGSFPVHVLTLLGLGAALTALGLPGPLERLVAAASSRTAALVLRR